MSGLLMYTEVKTIDNCSEEYLELKRQNEEYISNMEAMWKELNDIKERQSIWENMKKRD
jgi:hypothetical protein